MFFSKSHDCQLSGHKFEPRYDTSAAKIPWEKFKKLSMDPGTVDKFRTQTYVYDICKYCGTVVKRYG